MARHRVGVALLLDGEAAAVVNAVRLALGDPDLDRIPPHLTLVQPTNVRDEDIPAVLAAMRIAAARTAPFDVRLGPVTTFAPVTGTIHLAVPECDAAEHDSAEHDAAEQVEELRAAVAVGVLDRPRTHPFVAHVTLVAQAPLHRVHAAEAALAPMVVPWRPDRITLLREERGGDRVRRWWPWADVALAGVRMAGPDGFPLQMTTSSLVDPQALTLVKQRLPGGPLLVVTARADGADVVGVAVGTVGDEPQVSLAPGARALRVDDYLLEEWDLRAAG